MLANGTRTVTQSVYDNVGNTIATIDPLNHRTDITYDSRNRKVRTAGPAAPDVTTGGMTRPMTDYTYDGVGNVLTVTDPRNYITTSLYDAANRKIKVTAPAVPLSGHADYVSPVTQSIYDKVGNVLQVIDPNGHTTTNTYDPVNRLLTTTDGAGITVTYQYDAVGNRTQVKDEKGNATNFTYDGLKRSTSITDALAHATLFGYDALNKVARTDANGQLTTYGYDLRNRLLTVTYGPNAPPAPADRTYGYDPAGRLLTVTEPALGGAADVAYTYDALNRVTTETSGGLTHQYTYDLVGNRLQTVYGGTGRTLVSTYDALNRLQTITENPTVNGGRLTQYAYDASGNVVWKSLPNGDSVTTNFDGLNREVTIAGYSVTGNELYLYANGRDLVGNVTAIGEETANLPVRILANVYDGVNRLTSEQTAVNGQTTTTAYTYDNANNRASRTITDANGVTTANYTYDAANRLTGYTEGAKTETYGYDNAGSRTSWTENGALKASYGYDAEHRMTSLTQAGHTYAYTYDYRTRRVQRVEDGVSTKVIFSGGTSVQEIENNLTSVEYVRGSDWGGGVGGILYTLRNGAPSFTHYDGRGDVTAKTDGVGTVTYQASYQAFGTRTQENGATEDRQKANTKEEDPSGLLNEGMRYRDLVAGTFITADPAGFVDGPNLYAYVRQNPWSKFDPEGLSAAGWFADSFLNADTVKGGVELVRGADYATAAGWEEAGVGVVGTVAGTADAAFTVATCGLKGLVEGAIKGGIKALVKGAAEGEAKALVKVAVEDVAKTEAKQLGGKTAKQVVEEGEKTVAKETEEAASKEISKPPKGKGSVPPNQRDPKRVFSKNEKADALKERGGTCEQCGEKLDVDDAKGHHIERHADGGPTTKDNLANVCEDCHKELHR